MNFSDPSQDRAQSTTPSTGNLGQLSGYDAALPAIERFLKHHDMAASTFGRDAVSDPGLVTGLRDGRELRRATRAKIMAFMTEFEESQAEAVQ